jgi:hypothetical protein
MSVTTESVSQRQAHGNHQENTSSSGRNGFKPLMDINAVEYGEYALLATD